jgi:hypothetical protein
VVAEDLVAVSEDLVALVALVEAVALAAVVVLAVAEVAVAGNIYEYIN